MAETSTSRDSKLKAPIVDDNSGGADEKKQSTNDDDLGLSMDKLSLAPKKKLLVLCLGGLLVHRLHVREKQKARGLYPDVVNGSFLVFKRPFCTDFLKFCFERFDVALWSSAREHNIDGVLSSITGEEGNKFVFVWGQSECSDSGFPCLHEEEKPLFLKELKSIWENESFKGQYSASNTLLIDDEVQTCLLNPPNTAIFPNPYRIHDLHDSFLGPNGELRKYLDGLVDAKDVPSYVKDHSIGQPAITAEHKDWRYYEKIIGQIKGGRDEKKKGCANDDGNVGLSLDHHSLGPKKKLLVLCFGGLLVHRVHKKEKQELRKVRGLYPEVVSGSYSVFKRPYCTEFLKFCLERFDVVMWSTANEHNFDDTVNTISGGERNKFVFVWGESKCKNSGFRCLPQKVQPLFLKRLELIWENRIFNGQYSASNTLLIDIEPHTALLNPPNTAIFPHPYKEHDAYDTFLAPNGILWKYLDCLVDAEDVPTYVKDHPIGQPAITEDNPDWDYYRRVVSKFSHTYDDDSSGYDWYDYDSSDGFYISD